jgi:hypothetical protein
MCPPHLVAEVAEAIPDCDYVEIGSCGHLGYLEPPAVFFGEDKPQACLDFIVKNWTGMRPDSLIREMEADAAARQHENGASGNGPATKKKAAASKK